MCTFTNFFFSSFFFFFFVNELALEIAKNGLYGIQLISDVVQVLIILSADDVILTSYCIAGSICISR